MFPGDPESYDLYRAFEEVGQPDMGQGAISVRREGRLVAGAPTFRLGYRLDTPLQGRLRSATDWIAERAPRLLRFDVVGLGSPSSDNLSLGFASDLTLADRQQCVADMLSALDQEATRTRATILTVKGLGAEAEELEPVLTRAGFTRTTSVPVVMLSLPFKSMDAYLGSLDRETRAYLKRKLRGSDGLRIEYRDSTEGLDVKLNELYAATLAQSRTDHGDLERLHPDWFREVKARLGNRARLLLCWKGDELLSFHFLIVGENRVISSKIGMKYPEARQHNLYFVNFLKTIQLAIESGIPELEMGATAYKAKLLFGGRLERRWIQFKFRNGLINKLARPVAPLLDFERNDPELQRLRAKKAA